VSVVPANAKRILRFVFGTVRNFIVEWAQALCSMAVRRDAHVGERKSEDFGKRMIRLCLICHAGN